MLYVTGITGHSGKWFLKRLQEENYPGKLRFVMRQPREDDPLKYELFADCTLDIEFAVGDITDPVFLLKSLAGVDTVVHTAGIDKSTLLVETAIISQVKRTILVHTTGRFSKFKSASEEYIRIEDRILSLRDRIDITVLRPTMIYGSSQDRNMYRLVTFLDKYPVFPVFGDGSNLMQPVTAKDLGNAYYEVLIRPDITSNKEYDLSGDQPIQYIDIIRSIIKCLGSKVKIIHVPMGLSVFGAKVYNGIFGKRAIISVEQVLRMQEDKTFSHEAAALDFGYAPLSFPEGIKPEVEEYLAGTRVDFSQVKYK